MVLSSSSRGHWIHIAGKRSSLAVSYVKPGTGSMHGRTLDDFCSSHGLKTWFFHGLSTSAWLSSPSHSHLGMTARDTVCHLLCRPFIPTSTQTHTANSCHKWLFDYFPTCTVEVAYYLPSNSSVTSINCTPNSINFEQLRPD